MQSKVAGGNGSAAEEGLKENGAEINNTAVAEIAETPKNTDFKKRIDNLKTKFLPSFRWSLLLYVFFNFTMFVIGAYGVHKCPVNENIPLFLIVLGIIGLVSKLITFLRDKIIKFGQVKYVETALNAIELTFLILGTYWVYKEFKPSFDPFDKKLYCNKTVYLFAFVYLTVIYTLLLATLVGCICFLVCYCILKTTEKQNVNENESQIPYIDAEEDPGSISKSSTLKNEDIIEKA